MGTDLVEHRTEPTPMSLIQAAMENGCDPDRLEKLMLLQERWEQMEERKESKAAEVEYNAAMAECQAEIRPVVAKLKNQQTNSFYADLFAIDEMIRPIYTKHGFALSSGTLKSELDRHVYVYVDVLHKAGHSKRYGDDFPLDDSGLKGTVNKTPIQAKASTDTYARRYITMGIFNIAIRGMDRDGNAPQPTITTEQVGQINDLLEDVVSSDDDKDPLDTLLAWCRIDSLDQLPANRFREVCQSIKRKIQEQGKNLNASN